MSKINLNEERGFSDSITVTFNFIKQEFLPFLKNLGVLVVPLLFIDLFVKSVFLQDIIAMSYTPSTEGVSIMDTLRSAMWNYMSTCIMCFWIQLVGISYLRVYQDKFHSSDKTSITAGQVWQVMMKNIGKVFLWGLLYFLILVVGTVFLIIPGIYFGLALFFTTYLLIIKELSVGESMAASMALVKGKWWQIFGYLFLFQLIVIMIAWFFSIPQFVLTFKNVLMGTTPSSYEMTLGLLFSNFGQYLTQAFVMMGAGVKFFSLLEEKEHSSLLGKIDEMGSQSDRGDGQ